MPVLTESQTPVSEGDQSTNTTASALIKTGPGAILGIFVASASATPTIKVWKNTAASGTVLVNTFTPAAATFYPMPTKFTAGLYVTISGTVDCTVFWS